MAGGAKNDDDEVISSINVTPLVDIMLVLLIIFMVTAKYIVSQAIPLDLPKAATSGEQQTVFAVAIDKDGAVRADSKPVDDQHLMAAAKDALVKTPDLRTVIQASGDVPHKVVIHVLDLLRQAGITKIGFAVEKTATVNGVEVTAPK